MVHCVIDRIGIFGTKRSRDCHLRMARCEPGPEKRSMKYLMVLPVLILLILEQKRVVQVATRRLRRTL